MRENTPISTPDDIDEQPGPESADDGPGRSGPMRTCIVTRAVRPASELIRFVAGPDGAVAPDIRNRLPGRGVWVTNSRRILDQAIARKAFKRALKADVAVPADLADLVARLLRQDALQMVSIANKAGCLTTGFAKIEGMRGPILALVQASDGSPAETARLQGLCRTRGPGKTVPRLVRDFAAHELGLSIGREHVIHAALTVHDAASVFIDRALRYAEFLSDGPAKRLPASTRGPSGASESPPLD